MAFGFKLFDDLGREAAFDEQAVAGVASPARAFDGFLNIGPKIDKVGYDLEESLSLTIGSGRAQNHEGTLLLQYQAGTQGMVWTFMRGDAVKMVGG